jgi:peptidoglycan/LPS O-acetylase OafA/YrhL
MITAQPKNMKDHRRFAELDALRGIAALAVVLFHYTTRYNEIYGHSDSLIFRFPLGHYGVQLFFIISGFVIFMTLERMRTGMDFVVSRFSRLYPAYWVAVALTFSVVAFAALPGRQIGLSAAAVNLSMLQTFAHIPSVDGVYWTLAVELCFYAIMLGLFKARLLQRIESVAIVWLTLVISTSVAERYMNSFIVGPIKVFLIIEFANLFIAGIMFYKIRKGEATALTYATLSLCLIAQRFVSDWEATLVVLFCFLLFFATVKGWMRFIVIRPLVFLGTLTYTLYLVHQNIGYAVIKGLGRFSLNSNFSVLIAIAVSLSLASAITFLVEKPALNLIRKWHKRFQQPHYGAAPIQASAD